MRGATKPKDKSIDFRLKGLKRKAIVRKGNIMAFCRQLGRLGTLYRYLQSKAHLDDILLNENVYLNTLYRWSEIEQQSNARSDGSEGSLSFSAALEDSLGLVQLLSIDVWGVCFSGTMSREHWERSNAECAYKVKSYQFFEEIAKRMVDRSDIGMLMKINYLSDQELFNIDPDKPAPMAMFTKSTDFQWEVEYRLCFEDRTDATRNGNYTPKNWFEKMPSIDSPGGFNVSAYGDRTLRSMYIKNVHRLKPLSIHVPGISKFIDVVEKPE